MRGATALADDLLLIPVPGHTPGSLCLLYRRRFLRSLERLLDFEFQWVLPGHGRPFRADSTAAMRRELERALGRLRAA